MRENRKRRAKAVREVQDTPAGPAERTYSTRILGPLLREEYFSQSDVEPDAWLAHDGPGLIAALSWGFEADDAMTRAACCVLTSDVLVLMDAANAAQRSGVPVRVGVRNPIGSQFEPEYADALRDLAHVVRIRPGGEGVSNIGFDLLSDLLVEHMDALADGGSHREEAAA